ncbi:MAG: hypothetical protein IJ727_09620 [Treponema sp.]|nr:hypothetical protein [Treponema sp.]
MGNLKSIFALIGILFVPVSLFADAWLGASFSYCLSTEPDECLSFSARSDISPLAVSFNAHLEDNTITLFLDDWFINERISDHLDYYVLWGMSYGATFEDEEKILAMGGRFGAGFDFFFLHRSIELFLQAVWNPYFGIKKKNGDFSPLFYPVNFPGTAGFRIWF